MAKVLLADIRREIENRLTEAVERGAWIELTLNGDTSVALQCDLTCETDHVEGTDRDGRWREIPYEEIRRVSVAER
jgi:hypothetical protein